MWLGDETWLRSRGRKWAASFCPRPLGLGRPIERHHSFASPAPGAKGHGPFPRERARTVAPALIVALFCGSQRGVHVHTVRAEPAHRGGPGRN